MLHLTKASRTQLSQLKTGDFAYLEPSIYEVAKISVKIIFTKTTSSVQALQRRIAELKRDNEMHKLLDVYDQYVQHFRVNGKAMLTIDEVDHALTTGDYEV
jgi:DNA/RNA-binding domain of Phe-tRNA-synthetase-like protein